MVSRRKSKIRTARLLDAINSGSIIKVRRALKQRGLDLTLSVDCLEEYTDVHVPQVKIDILDINQLVQPDSILGCAIIQPDHTILQLLLLTQLFTTISDRDVIFGLYHACTCVQILLVNTFPGNMIDSNITVHRSQSNLPCQYSGYLDYLSGFYSPLQIIVLSLIYWSGNGRTCPHNESMVLVQMKKLTYLFNCGAVLTPIICDGHSLITQFFISGQSGLARFLLDLDECRMHQYELEDIVGILIQNFQKASIYLILKFIPQIPISPVSSGHDKLIDPTFVVDDIDELASITEYICSEFFFFYGRMYTVTRRDNIIRLYNLYQHGCYLSDPLNHVGQLPMNDMGKDVRGFVQMSTKPKSLAELCFLKIKIQAGPRNHLETISTFCDLTNCPDRYKILLTELRNTKEYNQTENSMKHNTCTPFPLRH